MLIADHAEADFLARFDAAPDTHPGPYLDWLEEQGLRTEGRLRTHVLAKPEADWPRLALAEFWEREGQADRAAFVRIQVELAKGCPACDGSGRNVMSPCPCAHWRAWERALLHAHHRAWTEAAFPPPAPGEGRRWMRTDPAGVAISSRHLMADVAFRRGFVEEVALSWEAWAGGGGLYRCGACGCTSNHVNPVRGRQCPGCGSDFVAKFRGVAELLLASEPIRVVRLTTLPLVEGVLGLGGGWLTHRVRIAGQEVSVVQEDFPSEQIHAAACRARWPSVREWVLPDPPVRVDRLTNFQVEPGESLRPGDRVFVSPNGRATTRQASPSLPELGRAVWVTPESPNIKGVVTVRLTD